MAELSFNPKGEWIVVAHNLADPGDVEQIAGPYATKTQAEEEAERLGRSPTSK